ncbi:MAG TPA: hypothetical protein VFQ53_13975 [Kofleriaceae bacterium]|nr:hypothetical protein [Kofleriaceae bacterium]
MHHTHSLATIDLALLDHVTGGAPGGDKYENVIGDLGSGLGSYVGGKVRGAPGAIVGGAVGGFAGRAVGRAVDNLPSAGPLPGGSGYSQGRGPGSLNRGASGPF